MTDVIDRPAQGSALLSKVTRKFQTTLPSGVRKALGLEQGDELTYVIEGDHAVIAKAAAEDMVPALEAFVEMLKRDMETHPERMQGIPSALLTRIRVLVAGVPVDHDEEVEGAVAL